MPPAGFEPSIPARKRLETYALRPRGHRDRFSEIRSCTKSVTHACFRRLFADTPPVCCGSAEGTLYCKASLTLLHLEL
jgi:hypothetical protein